jgi:hypothetical protein
MEIIVILIAKRCKAVTPESKLGVESRATHPLQPVNKARRQTDPLTPGTEVRFGQSPKGGTTELGTTQAESFICNVDEYRALYPTAPLLSVALDYPL